MIQLKVNLLQKIPKGVTAPEGLIIFPQQKGYLMYTKNEYLVKNKETFYITKEPITFIQLAYALEKVELDSPEYFLVKENELLTLREELKEHEEKKRSKKKAKVKKKSKTPTLEKNLSVESLDSNQEKDQTLPI